MFKMGTIEMGKIMYIREGNPCTCQVHHVMKICVYCIAHSYSPHHVDLKTNKCVEEVQALSFSYLTLVPTDFGGERILKDEDDSNI